MSSDFLGLNGVLPSKMIGTVDTEYLEISLVYGNKGGRVKVKLTCLPHQPNLE